MDNGSKENSIILWVVEVIIICIGIILCIFPFIVYLNDCNYKYCVSLHTFILLCVLLGLGLSFNINRVRMVKLKNDNEKNYSQLRKLYNFIFHNSNREILFYILILYVFTWWLVSAYSSDSERDAKTKKANDKEVKVKESKEKVTNDSTKGNTNICEIEKDTTEINKKSYWNTQYELPNNNYVIYIAFILGLLGFFFSIQGKVEAHDGRIAAEKALQALENVKSFDSLFDENNDYGFSQVIKCLENEGIYTDKNVKITLFLGFPIVGFLYDNKKVREASISAFNNFINALITTNKEVEIHLFKHCIAIEKFDNFCKSIKIEEDILKIKTEDSEKTGKDVVHYFYKIKKDNIIIKELEDKENLRFYTIQKKGTTQGGTGAFWIVRDNVQQQGFTSNVVYSTNDAVISMLNEATRDAENIINQ